MLYVYQLRDTFLLSHPVFHGLWDILNLQPGFSTTTHDMINLRKRDPGPVLGLGWLLALSVGGGVLLFSAIGLLLAWRIKRRPEPYTTATYYGPQLQLQQQQMRQQSSDDDENDGVPPPGRRGTRLLKRGFFASSTSVGYLSSHFSLPRVPSLQSLNLSGNRLSRTFTLDEEAAHGPKVKKTVSETWLRDNWFSRTPTLPDVDAREGEGEGARRYGGPEVVEVIEMDRDGDDGKVGKKGGWTEQRIEVVKKQHNGMDTKAGLGVSSDDGSPVWERPEVVLETLHHQTKSAPSSPDKQQYHSPQRQSPKKQPPPQSPQQQEGRRSVTETDLRFILLSTEQRCVMVANRRLRPQGIHLQSLIILWERRPRHQRLPRATAVLRLLQQRTRQRPLGATSALGPRGYRLPPARARQERGPWVMVSRRLERIVGPAPSVVRQTASSRRPSRSLRTLLMAV